VPDGADVHRLVAGLEGNFEASGEVGPVRAPAYLQPDHAAQDVEGLVAGAHEESLLERRLDPAAEVGVGRLALERAVLLVRHQEYDVLEAAGVDRLDLLLLLAKLRHEFDPPDDDRLAGPDLGPAVHALARRAGASGERYGEEQAR